MSLPTLLLPAALVDPEWLGADRLAALAARPGWTAVARRARLLDETGPADPPPSDPGHERWLHARLRLPAGSAIAAASAIADGRPGAAWRLDPVHLHVGRDHLVLTDPAALALGPDESAALAAAVAPLFADEGLVLDAASPSRWYLHERDAGRALRLATRPLSGATGRNVDAWMPTGPDARRWRRMVNEVQMTWHAHAVNARREERRAPSVNSLWIEGRVPPPDDAGARAAAGVAAHATGSAPLRITAPDAAPLAIDARLHEAALAGDPQRWAAAWTALDADTFDAIAQAREPWIAGARVVLAGDAGWRELAVPPRADWRFWRRVDPAAWLAAPRGTAHRS
ncbi:MAG: hypothetical protein RJA99_4473 [Pseudomonadota bacterium]|jgi:hypothetical protein